MLTLVTCKFDQICVQQDVTKIKTIGDGYMAVCGVPKAVRAHPEKCVDCGLAFIRDLRDITSSRQLTLQVRRAIRADDAPSRSSRFDRKAADERDDDRGTP